MDAMESTINSTKTILIVEDDLALRNALSAKLNHEGFSVLSAENGQEGLKKAIESKPDLILLDVVMPVMDGMQMAAELQKDDWGKRANIIVLTNLSDNDHIVSAVKNHVFEYIVKSNKSLEDIVKEIKNRLATLDSSLSI